MSATNFNLADGQRAERKTLITVAEWAGSGAESQVREILGTIGSSSLRWKKYWVTLADTDLPSKIVEIIKQATKQRETLGW